MKIFSAYVPMGAAMAIALLSGCGGSQNTPTPSPANPADVYVAGEVYGQQNGFATYWKNGHAVSLNGFSLGSSAHAIAVFGTDVHVAGVGSDGGQDIATYWKNGVATRLTDGTATGFANGIFVTNGDVYIAGGESTVAGDALVAKYWKNGSAIVLAAVGQNSMANAIYVSGTDVYVAGYTSETTQMASGGSYTTQVATLWKNGTPVALTDGLHSSGALSVFVSGADVYVAGFSAQTSQRDDSAAMYWQNGSPVVLKDISGSFANSIAVSGSDVFVAGGNNNHIAEYWKNGNQVTLPGGTVAAQMAVSGSDVYIVGNNFPSAPIGPGSSTVHASDNGPYNGGIGATCWENGNPTALAPYASSSVANAIAVVSSN